MKRTGHRSEKSVRKYKRSSDEISENVSNVLNPPSSKIMKSEGRSVAETRKEIENTSPAECKMVMETENPSAAEGKSAPSIPIKAVPFRDITDKNVFQNCQVAFNFY